jgi:actin-like ATPase involved in cell morphogenesis
VSGIRLGIDYGTSNTVAALRRPDGRIELLLFDGSPLLPSGVFLALDGTLLTGRDAVYSARAQPDRFEPAPKRCVDDGLVLIGDGEVPVDEVIGATLRRVALEAEAASEEPVREVVLTYPASWGPRRRQVLVEASRHAGLPAPAVVPEPVAAAQHYTTRAGTTAPPGRRYLVYDLGAGTFDAAVVEATTGGFEVLVTGGLADTGGLDIDATIVAHVGAVYADRLPDVWQSLEHPADRTQQRLSRQLWDDIRTAKETLSRAGTTFVHIPGTDVEVPLGREHLDRIATPVLRRTVNAARTLLRDAQAGRADGADVALLLVGGASRMPLVATLLHRHLGQAPQVVEQPELVVALGAVAGPDVAPARPPATARPALPPAVARPVPSPAVAPPASPPAAAPRPRQPTRSRTAPEGFTEPAHLLYVTLPALEGYAVRRYQQRTWDGTTWRNDEPAFLDHDGRLLLFARPETLLTHVRAKPQRRLRLDADWVEAVEQTIADADRPDPDRGGHPIAELVDEGDRINLDLALYSAAGGPRLWAPEVLVPARDLAAELAYALDLDLGGLLDTGGPIDRLDDLLRVAGPRSVIARRRARALDATVIAAQWRTLIARIEAAATPGPQPSTTPGD